MRIATGLAGALIPALLALPAGAQDTLLWHIVAEQAELRIGKDTELLAWDVEASVGKDELKLVARSKAEMVLDDGAFETLETTLRLESPVSDFFDLAAGVSLNTPEGPDRVYALVGLHGLAPQWVVLDADLYLSDRPFLRVEAEYEGLITNRLILTPMVELTVPLRDDPGIGTGGGGAVLEAGARLSWDLVDRAIAPYIGVHYERAFGETSVIRQQAGDDPGEVFFVAGVRIRL